MTDVINVYLSLFGDNACTCQVCYIPVELMKILGIKCHDYVSLSKGHEVNGERLICKTLPMCSSKVDVGFQVIANLSVICDTPKYSNMPLSVNSETKIINIKPLVVVNVKYVAIDIILSSVENVVLAKKYFEGFQKDVKNLLNLYKFKGKSVIKCSDNPLAKLLGISYFYINHVVLDELPNSIELESIGQLSPYSSVVVSDIQSTERQLHLIKDQTCLGGVDYVLNYLQALVTDKWNLRETFAEVGASYPSGILLSGPPGSGKSSLVRQLCCSTQACLVTTNDSELHSQHKQEKILAFRQISEKACTLSKEGPCILFIDEIDSLCPTRTSESSFSDLELTGYVSLMLQECRNYPYLIIIAATNRPYIVDASLRKSGCLELEILLSAPSLEERKSILDIYTQDFIDVSHPMLWEVASATPGFVGADLKYICHKVKEKFSTKISAIDENFSASVCQEMLRLCDSTLPSIHKNLEFITRRPALQPVGGLEDIKETIGSILSSHLKHSKFYHRFRLKKSKGILLYGPRGCGKTRLISLLASQKGYTFISANAANLLSPYVGGSEKRITALFHTARVAQPSIVFIDEIDSLFGSRESSGNGAKVNILTELLQAMDGSNIRAESQQGIMQMKNKAQSIKDEVLVFAATNHPERLDSALLRPGRFDHIIYIPPPDRQSRIDILKLQTSNTDICENLIEQIADKSENWTGAELGSLISQVAVKSVLEMSFNDISKRIIVKEDILWDVFRKFRPTLSSADIEYYKSFEKTVTRLL